MANVKMIKKIYIHAGIFHADDALCAAMARELNPNVEIIRSFRAPEDYIDAEAEKSGIYVADLGGGRFDHHQPDARTRENGEKFAACGLLFEVWGELLFPHTSGREAFLKSFIIPVEIQDNGGQRNPLSEAIKSLNPAWDSEETSDAAFEKAVALMKGILEQEMKNDDAAHRAEEEVKADEARSEASRGDGIVIFKRFRPWQGELTKRDYAKFVVFPSNRGGYNLQVVPRSLTDRTPRVLIPRDWLENKPEGCTFVHPGLFMASFGTEEQAVQAAEVLV